eukprot:98448_1
MPANKDDIINVQQAQLETLLKRLNELNNDHQKLLDIHKNSVKTPTSMSNKFGNFGIGLKRRISNLTTPRNSAFKSVHQHHRNASFDSSTESQSDHDHTILTPISTLSLENKSIQTTMYTISPIKTKDICTQTSKDKSEYERKQSELENKLMEKNYTLTKQYIDLKHLYDDILQKHNSYDHKIDMRDEQIKDLAIQRNKLRKKLLNTNTKNKNLMQVLEMKSKMKLDPDIRKRDTIAIHNVQSNSNSEEQSYKSEEKPIHNRIYNYSAPNSRRNSIQGLLSLSPIKPLKTLFKPIETTEQKLSKDSVTLANKLMKVIQDKDSIISGLHAQLNNLNTFSNSTD